MQRSIPFVALLSATSMQAQTPTWSDDIVCIFYSHCTTCHRPDGIGGEHLDLMGFAEAHDHRTDIRDATNIRYMPPWPPDQQYRRMAHERQLTQDEIDLIAAWADGGGPEGDVGNAPPPPVYTSSWAITDPDITVRMADYTLPTMTEDNYRAFVLHVDVPEDVYIRRFEVVPGNTAAVHHVLVYQDTTGQAQQLDDADPAPGYTSFGGIGVSNAELVGLWAPGAGAWTAPPGMGILLHAGADVVIQVHYPESADGLLDSTRVNFELATSPFVRPLAIAAPLEHTITMTDGPLIIPPNEVRTFHNQFTVTFPATITSIGPHAHLLCQRLKAFAVTPTNDTIHLIDIPHWDFHWQGLYDFRNPIFLPIGTVLHGEATYDNAAANEENPNDPPDWVTLGESTTDEMMLFYFAYTLGVEADTLTVIDNSEHPPHYQNCAPTTHVGIAEQAISEAVVLKPSLAHERFTVSVDRPGCEALVVNAAGQQVLHAPLAPGDNTIEATQLGAGAYHVVVHDRSGAMLFSGPLVLQ